jgi:hypothetical protein
VAPLDLYMFSTTLPAILAVIIAKHVVLAWKERSPVKKCAPCPEFEVDPAAVARVKAYCALLATPNSDSGARFRAYSALSMAERYGSHGPP